MSEKRKWKFLFWHPGKMETTQQFAGPFDSLPDADEERRRLRAGGYMCALSCVIFPPRLAGEGAGGEGVTEEAPVEQGA